MLYVLGNTGKWRKWQYDGTRRSARVNAQHDRHQTDSHVVLVGDCGDGVIRPLVVIVIAFRPGLVKVHKLGALGGEQTAQ